MKDGNAAGRETEYPGSVQSGMRDMLVRMSFGIRGALVRAEEEDTKYDDAGRLRDREMGIAARLCVASAQMIKSLAKLEELSDRRAEKRGK